MFSIVVPYLPTAFASVLLTCIIELLVAVLFRIYSYKIIIAVNVATQIFLHAIILTVFYTSLYSYANLLFLLAEAVILFLEFFLYCSFFRDRKRTILFLYAFTAFAIPKRFKVIIQYESGEVFVSNNEYYFTEFNQVTTLDFNTDMTKVSAIIPIGEYGDLNDDGIIDSTDYALIKRYNLGMIDKLPNLYGKFAADFNCDGGVNSTDIIILRRYILKTISSLPYIKQ